jgi:S-adenosylmethionine decarboxylase
MLADFYGVAADMLANAGAMEKLLIQAARHAGAHVLFSHFHAFGEGSGITGVVLLAESHMSIHTWPEEGFAAADIFMCGAARADKALEVMRAALVPAQCEVRTVSRGGLAVSEEDGSALLQASPQ